MSAVADGHEYVFLNAYSGTALDHGGAGETKANVIVGWDMDRHKGRKNQIWKVKYTEKDKVGRQWCTITNRGTGANLALTDGNPEDSTPLLGEDANNPSHNQQWLFSLVPKGEFPSYVIYHRGSWDNTRHWHCVDLVRGNKTNGTKVQIWNSGPEGWNQNQAWVLVRIN